MKLLAGILTICCILTGCSSKEHALDNATDLRRRLLQGNSCSFDVTVSAFYDENIFTYELSCASDRTGNLKFTVVAPESISGITGILSADEAALTFDSTVLAFPKMADGRVSPVSGPWIFYNTLCNGYITACGNNKDGFLLSIDDSYESGSIHLEIQTDHQTNPVGVEIYYNQQRVILLQISNFKIQ